MPNFEVGNKEIPSQIEYVYVQRVQGLGRQSERTAMLTVVSCVLLLLLLVECVLGFPKGKSLFEASRTRVGCLVHSFSVGVCVAVSSCVSQHFFRAHLSTALNAHGTNASRAGRLCVRTHKPNLLVLVRL